MMAGHAVEYTDYHPRWLRRRVSTYWWLTRRSYFSFILREISSVFVAWSVVYLLLIVRAISTGEAAFRDLLAWSAQPLVLTLNVLSLLLVTLHAVTWFNLAPQAMVVHLGHTKVPGFWIAAANYIAWVVVSAAAAWILLGR
jgi:fumarate reductase subunit C